MSVEFKVGMQIRVKTKTKDDVFGTVVYEIVQVGLPNRGVLCSMLYGTGIAARAGYPVMDTEDRILADIAKCVTEIVPESERAANKQRALTKKEAAIPNRALGIEM